MAASWHGVAGKHWQGGRGGPPPHAQLVDRASSPLTLPADGSVPAGEHTQQDVLLTGPSGFVTLNSHA